MGKGMDAGSQNAWVQTRAALPPIRKTLGRLVNLSVSHFHHW